jgi:mannose-6-phosphate isomerase-like protein (cupin superfamily)
MSSTFDHLPEGSHSYWASVDFPKYESSPSYEWIKRSLNHLSINGITAIYYICTHEWKMPERTIRDDMFFYIVKGLGTARVGSQSVVLKPGTCAHFRRGVLHSATTEPKNPIHVISLHFNATVLGSLTIPELFGFPAAFATHQDKEVERIMHEACREYALRPPGHERSLEALVCRLLFHFIRNYSHQLKMDNEEKKLSDLQRLLPALELMRGDFKANLPLKHYAQKASLSEVQFRRVLS